MSDKITLSCEDVKQILSELDVFVVSIDQIGSYYAIQEDLNGFHQEVGKFFLSEKFL